MLDTDPTAAVDELEHDLADLDELEPDAASPAAQNGSVAAYADDEATALVSALAVPVEEPTELGDLDAAALDGLGARPLPIPKLPLLKRKVYGRYRSAGAPFQVELRVDVDGPSPTMRISADYYAVSGATISYFGSMRVDAPAVAVTASHIVITGLGRYTWAAGAPRVKVTIPRVPIVSTPAAATMQHLLPSGSPGATYVCRYLGPAFRAVVFEQDCQDTVPAPFTTYNTGSYPSGGPTRSLSVVSAFAEAGVQLLTTGATNVISTAEAGTNAAWSDAELHASMIRHFSRWRDVPQWAVWLFHAKLHDLGTGLYGIMFDQQGKQRQGCAVFYAGIGGATADARRLQAYTCVHELGHCFNLLHSWQKSLAIPPQPNRPASPSWMNYPWRFPGGPGAFWSAFPFRFDAQELVHIRHGFLNDVIMGGNPFRVGSALEDLESWRDPVEDRSGLRLSLEAPASFPYGAPVTVQVKLTSADPRGQTVTKHLRPRNGNVEIAIAQPDGRVVAYEPLLHHCMSDDDAIVLGGAEAAYADTAFIHYGKDGFYFDRPGTYRLRARYTAPDGSAIVSDTATIRVRPPATAEDAEVAELLFGDEQGTLMYLVGSDFAELQQGNDALTRIWEEHPEHPLADVARLIQGVNAAREFKEVQPDGSLTVRKADADAAAGLLAPVLDMGAIRKTSAKAKGDEEIGQLTAVARQLRTEVAPDLPDALAGYVISRRREIAAEVGTALQ
jgi:hypothetical protein